MKRHTHNKRNVITEAAAYLECSHRLVFVFGLVYSGTTPTRELIDHEMELWHKRDIIPDWLGDFCLDLLTGKCRVDMDERNTTWSVVRVKRKQLGGGNEKPNTS